MKDIKNKRTASEIDLATRSISAQQMNITYLSLSTFREPMFKYNNKAWGTMAFDIKREALEVENKTIFNDKEVTSYNAIYFLIGIDKEDNLREKIYVGQACIDMDGNSAIRRIQQHIKARNEKYFSHWNRAIVITNKEENAWGSTEICALESIMIQRLKDLIGTDCDNDNKGSLKGQDSSDYNEYIREIEMYLAFLNIEAFRGISEAEDLVYIGEFNDNTKIEDLREDKEFKGNRNIPEINTPNSIVVQMIDKLEEEYRNRTGKELWTDEHTFLDPACKGGEFLQEIYGRLMKSEYMISKYPDTIKRSIYILQNQIFGIALSNVSKNRTAAALKGFDMNIKIIKSYIDYLKYSVGKQEAVEGLINTIKEELEGYED